mmetsp:Transcript_98392/g.219714  ORF Transcript_98392/g.219714 Transcript_98392/m.219714 type:complete len:391 (-) Transcript_98392:173-1345(-)
MSLPPGEGRAPGRALATLAPRWDSLWGGGPIRALRGSRSGRRWLAAAALTCGLCFGARVLAARLVGLLLYHPFRYEDDRSHTRTLQRFTQALRRVSYRLEEIECPVSEAVMPHPKGALPQRFFLVRPEERQPPLGDSTNSEQPLWAFFGGNAMVATDWLPFCWDLLTSAQEGSPAMQRPAFLLMDYPGYGANPGDPSPRSILAGQLAALRAALGRLPGSSPRELHLLGHSLGAAAAAQLAVHLHGDDGEAARGIDCSPLAAAYRPGRLLLSAPFVSIDGMAQAIFGKIVFPSWLLWLLLNQHWSNNVWVPQASGAGWRVSIILGSKDEIVPTWMGRFLRDAVTNRGSHCPFVEIGDAGHNDLTLFTARYAELMGLAPPSYPPDPPRGSAL